jgi:peptide-methionine (S)-S-oxide reductase
MLTLATKMKFKTLPLALTLLLFACSHTEQTSIDAPTIIAETPDTPADSSPADAPKPVVVPQVDGKARAYFASGCFWCVEAVYESVKGVEESISGYAGGHTENPTYELSNTGKTGHAEAVEIIYDPSVVNFATLVDVYFGSQVVTQVNGQGPDHGSQYRSILFYQDAEQKQIIADKITALEATLGGDKVAAEVMPFEKFWVGEDYHQNYERLNPSNGYIQRISIPRLKKFQSKFPHLLKDSAH